jgi:hypothetical protein
VLLNRHRARNEPGRTMAMTALSATTRKSKTVTTAVKAAE